MSNATRDEILEALKEAVGTSRVSCVIRIVNGEITFLNELSCDELEELMFDNYDC